MAEEQNKTLVDNVVKEKLGIKENPVDKKIDLDEKDFEKEVPFDFTTEIDEDPKEVKKEDTTEVKPKEQKVAKKIDLSKISIIDTTELNKDKDLKQALYGGMSAFQIVLAQSGYMAKVIPLVHKDIVRLLSSNLSTYEYQKAVYQVVFNKIVSISSGKMDFETWLKETSREDLETFYYGIYCVTFPNEGNFVFTCPNCGNETTLEVPHNNLFRTTDKNKMKKLINNISKNAITDEARQKYTLIGKNDAFQLTTSGIIAELRTPSLWDNLEILRTVPEKVINRDVASATNMLYIKRFLIPAGNSGFSEITDNQEILRTIDNLSLTDSKELQTAIDDRLDENRISYTIKNVKCPNCGHVVDETPISIEDILFTLIFENAQ